MAKKYGKQVPSVNISFSDGTHKQWKKWSEPELLREVTKLLTQKTKSEGRAVGDVKIVYARDPEGDYRTIFSFHSTEDCIYKLKPAVEPGLLRWFYETTS